MSILAGRVGVGAGAVVNIDRRVLFAAEGGIGIGLRNLAHRHANVRAAAFDVDLAGIGQWLDAASSTWALAARNFSLAFIVSPQDSRHP
jgi:hypothetical protein